MLNRKIIITLSVVMISICSIAVYLFSKKSILMVINGKTVNAGTNAASAIENIDNYLNDEYKMLNDGTLINSNDLIDIATEKSVKLTTDGNTIEIKTNAIDIKSLLEEKGYSYTESNDYYVLKNLSLETLITDEMEIVLVHRIIKEDIKEIISKIKIKYKNNENLEVGETKVIDEGSSKVTNKNYKVILEDGEEVSRKLISTKVVDKGSYKIIEKGTKKVTETASIEVLESSWDKLAKCESGGRWDINTGNGHYGGLQFNKSTWNTASAAVGLDIDYAHEATREEQILAAEWLYSQRGWSPWKGCAKKVGLL